MQELSPPSAPLALARGLVRLLALHTAAAACALVALAGRRLSQSVAAQPSQRQRGRVVRAAAALAALAAPLVASVAAAHLCDWVVSPLHDAAEAAALALTALSMWAALVATGPLLSCIAALLGCALLPALVRGVVVPWLPDAALHATARPPPLAAALLPAAVAAAFVGWRLCAVGLTGAIASGKSTVSAALRAKGAVVLDADEEARAVVAPGSPGLAAIVRTFGDGVLNEDGVSLDRAALGRLVFGDPARRRQLNRITHGRVALRLLRGLLFWRVVKGRTVVIDAALLVASLTGRMLCHPIVVVVCRPEVQLKRLLARDAALSEADARARIAAAVPEEALLAAADCVIDNSGTRADLDARIDRVAAKLGL